MPKLIAKDRAYDGVPFADCFPETMEPNQVLAKVMWAEFEIGGKRRDWTPYVHTGDVFILALDQAGYEIVRKADHR